MSSSGIHLFGIAETWLKPSVSDGEISIPNCMLFRKERRLHGGGVCVYCHKSIAIRRRFFLILKFYFLEKQITTRKYDKKKSKKRQIKRELRERESWGTVRGGRDIEW